MNKEKIINTFRKADKKSVYIDAAEVTGWLIADAQKRGFTKADAVQMAKQHFIILGEVFSDFAVNHLESACSGLKPMLKEVK